jgi:hypothetical protein
VVAKTSVIKLPKHMLLKAVKKTSIYTTTEMETVTFGSCYETTLLKRQERTEEIIK